MKPLVSVEIDIGDFGTINTVTASDYAENSAFKGGEYAGSAISYKKNDLDPFILDHSKLDNSKEYTDIYNGLVSNCVTFDRYMEDFYKKGVSGYLVNNYDSTLYYGYGYKITIKGENIKSFTVEFDKSVGYYPTYMMLGSRDVYMNDDYTFTHLIDSSRSGVQEYRLVIVLMSKPNVPVVIKSITIDDKHSFSSQDSLVSFVRGSQSVQDFSLPSYGIVANYGKLSFIDTPSKHIYNLINKGYIKDGLGIKLYIDGNLVGTYQSNNDWKYNIYNNTVNVSLIGYLTKLQNSTFQLLLKDGYGTSGIYGLFRDLINFIKSTYPDVVFEDDFSDGSDLYKYIKEYSIDVQVFDSDTVWSQLDKLCKILQWKIYELPNGNIKILEA